MTDKTVYCSCCPDGIHVKCQHVVPGMRGGFPCSREPEPGRLYCANHADQHATK